MEIRKADWPSRISPLRSALRIALDEMTEGDTIAVKLDDFNMVNSFRSASRAVPRKKFETKVINDEMFFRCWKDETGK